VRSLKDTTIHFKFTTSGKINIVTDFGKYTLNYIEGVNYPDIPKFEIDKDANEISINGNELKTAFDKSSFAMSKEEMRPAMMGTLFEFSNNGLRFVTTDGHRLVNLLYKNIKSISNNQYVVPEKAISVLSKILDDKDVTIRMNKSSMSFKLNDIELITRLISQKYPDYASVIPLENELTLKVNTKEILDSIKRMMLFSTNTTKRVKFSISQKELDIFAEDVDTGASGEEKVSCEFSGDNLEIGFNCAYVQDVLSHLTSEEEIIFKLHSATKAVIIEPVEKKENSDIMMLLMPVRLNS